MCTRSPLRGGIRLTTCERAGILPSSSSSGTNSQHPSFWTAVDGLRGDCVLKVSTQLLQHNRELATSAKKRRRYAVLQKRLQNLCQDLLAERRSLEYFLSAVGHCIRLE
ncbi:hypothetical protein V1264_016358 [Littorina saxatilis]|uniref:Uncharacterized protein n=1 Tax=Littorina saxatilis TaxID=31220 RepID=A0AAN9BP82_9CAEN